MLYLKYATNKNEILQSLHTFNRDGAANHDLAIEIVIRTSYWVYNPASKTFGPNKFVAYRNMNFQDYDECLSGRLDGLYYFEGDSARRNVEKILGPYHPDPSLEDKLVTWAESLFHPGVVQGVNTNKWKFAYLR